MYGIEYRLARHDGGKVVAYAILEKRNCDYSIHPFQGNTYNVERKGVQESPIRGFNGRVKQAYSQDFWKKHFDPGEDIEALFLEKESNGDKFPRRSDTANVASSWDEDDRRALSRT
ncbi:hypothetical protein KDW_31610 [Dictyobacter vulcani]|uniref:Uncharacterized protein n=1 Tax=Dictyobacter vulcani TaxID=2607529 RepID=A0A5J4KSC4_9CHLR|nr:hypothetical protein KDW_31610 [Dictyobacter vulcani]